MSIVASEISKIFSSKNKETLTLNKVNISVKSGEFVCLLGPSGCGKSTLLNIIAGIEQATKGTVTLDDKLITKMGPDRAMMFQESALFPWLRVIDNVELGMKIAKIPKEERRERALKHLKMVHLTKFQNCFIHELSGGMKQRVALARALTLDSEVLLMDEPFAALDSHTRTIMHYELQKIWWKTKKTVVFVTHSAEEAVLLADRVMVMSANPGEIKKEFKIKLARPRIAEDSNFIHTVSMIKEELKEEVNKVAQAEYDNDWDITEDIFLPDVDSDMGANI